MKKSQFIYFAVLILSLWAFLTVPGFATQSGLVYNFNQPDCRKNFPLLAAAQEELNLIQYNEALVLFEKALQEYSDVKWLLPLIHFAIADCYLGLNQIGDAIEMYELVSAMPIDESLTDQNKQAQITLRATAVRLMGGCYQKEKEYDEAIEAYSGLVNAYPKVTFGPGKTIAAGAVESIYTCLERSFKLFTTNDAETIFQGFINNYPNTDIEAASLYYWARSYQTTGKKSLAIEKYQELIAKFPKTWWAENALRNIMALKGVISATIDIKPDTLNVRSGGKWITCYIELPPDYSASNIVTNSIKLKGIVPAEPRPTAIGDYDNDGVSDLMVKFKQEAVKDLIEVRDNVFLTVTGILTTGQEFGGADQIRVIETGQVKAQAKK